MLANRKSSILIYLFTKILRGKKFRKNKRKKNEIKNSKNSMISWDRLNFLGITNLRIVEGNYFENNEILAASERYVSFYLETWFGN